MSDDIVARLRYLAETYSPLIMDSEWNEAADEIERLRALAPEVRRLADRIEEFHRLAIELREADCGLVDMSVTTAEAFERLHRAERAFDDAIGFERPRLDAGPETGDFEEVQDARPVRIREARKPKRGGSAALRQTGSAETDGAAEDAMDDAG